MRHGHAKATYSAKTFQNSTEKHQAHIFTETFHYSNPQPTFHDNIERPTFFEKKVSTYSLSNSNDLTKAARIDLSSFNRAPKRVPCYLLAYQKMFSPFFYETFLSGGVGRRIKPGSDSAEITSRGDSERSL